MKQTGCLRRRVVEGRPYVRVEWCEAAVRDPEATEVQADGRVRHRRFGPELGKRLRVVTLADGETLHNRQVGAANAFPDRSYKPPGP